MMQTTEGTPYREFNLTGEFLAGPRVLNWCDGEADPRKKIERVVPHLPRTTLLTLRY